MDSNQYMLKRKRMFKWMLKEFSASNNSTIMHITPFNPANKTHTQKQPETSRSSLLLLATPSLPCPHYYLMIFPTKLKKKNSLRFTQVLGGDAEPHGIYRFTEFCLNLSSAIYISCVTLRRFLTSLNSFSSNLAWWLKETTGITVLWVPTRHQMRWEIQTFIHGI